MKRISMISGCLIALLACNDDANVEESTNDMKLGVIIQKAVSSDGDALILLKDGRAISPMNGLEDFPSTDVGKKLLLSFNVVSQNNGVFSVDVTNALPANDSTFAFESAPLDLADSVATAEFLIGSFSGSFTYCTNGNCSSGQTVLTLNGANYSCTKDVNDLPAGGAGEFSLSDLRDNRVTFTNNLEFASSNPELVLNGTYGIYAFEDYLSLTRWNDDVFVSYLLKK